MNITEDDILITYPPGERILDEKVINNVLSFIDGIPGDHFTTALKLLGSWQSLEALRKCLEEYLRIKLDNTKNYSSNIDILGKTLKEQGLSSEIRNMIINQLKELDNYFNEASKHKTKEISISENEYIIYGVGNVLRIIHEIL